MMQQWRVFASLLLLSAAATGLISQTPSSLSFNLHQQIHPHNHCIVAPLFMTPTQSSSDDSSSKSLPPTSRRRRLWKKSKKSIVSLALALSFLRTPAALAASDKYDTSARANDILIESLRPGATKEDAELALDSEVLVREKDQVNSMAVSSSTPETKKSPSKQKQKKNLYYDDDDELEDDQFFNADELASLDKAAKSKSTLKTATTSLNYKSSGINKAMYTKALFLFLTLPVLLFGGIETYKRRSESAYVEKALKIQRMKKEEYLKKTQTEADALKGNETDTDELDDDGDDDDEDEDDDDDDDDDDLLDEPPKPKPKKPTNDGGGDDSGPSADDIARLNKLMGR